MLPIETQSFGAIYPINFASPLPIAECRNRLQQSLGKAMGSLFTTIEGEVEMVDATTCKFRVYQNVSKGGKPTIVGYLYKQSETTTVVDAAFGREKRSIYEFVPLLVIVIIVCVAIQQLIGAIISVFGLVSIFYFEWRDGSRSSHSPRIIPKEPMSQLLWWFERTLKN